ncbi:TRIM2_3 [Mytilus coruscus]|uniref:TRIM2_3 n=1 Tax=Mytilus coruscus TaxID=42192 RepID=A0A6J8EH56_MYTCO|nr:TRIM2_3 [Mytilus coruscus]
MSTAVNIEELKKQFLECPICNELFNDTDRHPRVLPCLHSYCYTCLKKLIEQSKYMCLLCKSDFFVQNVSVDSFSKDNTRRDLLDFVRVGDHKSVIQCDECVNEKSISRCKDCSNFICKSCLAAHKTMKIFSDHEVFALDDFELSMDHVSEFRHAGMCSIHHKETLTLFCAGPECQTPICYSCCLTSHMPTDNKKHITRDIEEVYTEKVTSMIEKKAKVLKTEKELVGLSKSINEQLNILAQNAETTKTEIEAIFEIAVEMLQRRRDLLIVNTDKLKRDKNTLLKKQDSEVINFIETIRYACRFLDQTVATKNHSAFLLLSKTISDRLDHLQNTNYDIQPRDSNLISFTKGNIGAELQRFVDTVGKISSSSAFGPKTKVTFPAAIETEEDFDIIVEIFDYDDARLSEEMTITCVLFETADVPLTSVGELSFTHIGDGKYKASCQIMDTGIQRITKVEVMKNGREFYAVELKAMIKKKSEELTKIELDVNSSDDDTDQTESDDGSYLSACPSENLQEDVSRNSFAEVKPEENWYEFVDVPYFTVEPEGKSVYEAFKDDDLGITVKNKMKKKKMKNIMREHVSLL